jgi:hypothetical protein
MARSATSLLRLPRHTRLMAELIHSDAYHLRPRSSGRTAGSAKKKDSRTPLNDAACNSWTAPLPGRWRVESDAAR